MTTISASALAEIVVNLSGRSERQVVGYKLTKLWLTAQEFRAAAPAAARGTVIGSLLGILPGGGIVLRTFAAYMFEQRVAKDPSRFGKGAIEGLAAPEAANNAAAQTSFIPLLTLGIPTSPTLALLLGAMIIQGIQPGPEVMVKRPDLFWGLIASMFIGNVMLVIINLPLIGMWVQLLRVPYRILFPVIIVLCCIGAYSLENSQPTSSSSASSRRSGCFSWRLAFSHSVAARVHPRPPGRREPPASDGDLRWRPDRVRAAACVPGHRPDPGGDGPHDGSADVPRQARGVCRVSARDLGGIMDAPNRISS